MANVGITFDNKAIMDWLRETHAGNVEHTAEEVANAVRAAVPSDVPVKTLHKTDENGRPVSLVTVAHASGLARQARDGVLTRAAAAAGLDVTRYAT